VAPEENRPAENEQSHASDDRSAEAVRDQPA